MDGYEYELCPYGDDPVVEIADREHGCQTGRGCITIPYARLDEFIAWVTAIRDRVWKDAEG